MNAPEAESDWFSRMQTERQDAASKAIAAIKSLCEQFAALGIEEVRLTYDGYGDSGVIEDVHALAGGEEVALEGSLRNSFYNAAYDLLPFGWENDAGSFGDLILHVKERRVVREHHERIEEVNYDEEEWKL
jgi:hypothetical protein